MNNEVNNIEYIRSVLTERELLEQLAEEASELSQASLKLIRAKELSNNATPVSKTDAEFNFDLEVDDVYACLILLRKCIGLPFLDKHLVEDKIERWANRLREAESNER